MQAAHNSSVGAVLHARAGQDDEVEVEDCFYAIMYNDEWEILVLPANIISALHSVRR